MPFKITHRRLSVMTLLAAPATLALACDTIQNDYHITNRYGDGGADSDPGAGGSADEAGAASQGGEGGEGGAGASSGGGEGGESDGRDPRYPHSPLVNAKVADLELELWKPGNEFWFAVSDDQLKQMNAGSSGCCGDAPVYSSANWVDHLFVTTAGDKPQTADFGRVQARIVGNYSRFPWEVGSIPNLNIDADEFVKDQRIAGYEHLRFSNGQRGSVFRDRVTYDMFRMLGYPAPLVTYAWVASNVWGPEVRIPYLLVERYKRVFCDRYEEDFGGGCPNMWEYWGDFNQNHNGPKLGNRSLFDEPNNCQIDECDATRVKELEAKLREAPHGDGFKASLTDYVDWPAFHRFQCLSWILSTSDDSIHASNNVVLVERNDGKFQFLPYSVDISLGFQGSPPVALPGSSNALAAGCQAEPSCWNDTIDVCEDVLADLKKLDPHAYLDKIWKELEDNEMLRAADADQFAGISAYFTERLENASTELDYYRENKPCEYPYVVCNGVCVHTDDCQSQCVPPGEPKPVLGAGDEPIPEPCIDQKAYSVAP